MNKGFWALCLCGVFLAGCGTSPDPLLYALDSIPGAVSPQVGDTIKVVRPDVPMFLDRPEFVSERGPNQIIVNETVNWAEPMDLMFERLLTANLRQRLPHAVIESDSDDMTTPPTLVIETALQQFNAVGTGRAVLEGTLKMTRFPARGSASGTSAPVETVRSRPIALSQDSNNNNPASVAAKLSTLLGLYADQIVAALVASPGVAPSP